MRIAELSRTSGISIPTIKYYLREGLLPSGENTAPNQAKYDQQHLDRLSLIRALRDGAGLSISTIKRVLVTMDDYQPDQTPLHLSIAIRELGEPLTIPEDEVDAYQRAEVELNTLTEDLGWKVDLDSPGHDDAVRALVTIHRHLPGLITDSKQLHPFAQAVRQLAESEIPDSFNPAVDPEAVLHFSVLGTVLFEPIILALRKLAHVDRIRSTAAANRKPTPSP